MPAPALIALTDARRTVSFAFMAAIMSACILFSIIVISFVVIGIFQIPA